MKVFGRTDGWRTLRTVLLALVLAAAWFSSVPRIASALDVSVLSYGAVGDGTTNDRAAIQAAIDAVNAAGGGTVNLPGGYTFLTGDLTLKSNVALNLNANSVLLESQDPADYAHTPSLGRLISGTIPWNAWADTNYPLIFAGPGTTNVAIEGSGTIQMTYNGGDAASIIIHGIGFYEVSDFSISGITIDGSTMYNIALRQSTDGIVTGVTTANPRTLNSDGVSLANCQNIRVTGNDLTTGDDGIYVWASYDDPRGGTWWSTANPIPTRNIEVDNNNIDVQCAGGCHGFLFINWTGGAPDQSQVKVSNVYVHDNTIQATYPIGALIDDPYTPGPRTPTDAITFKDNMLTAVNGGSDLEPSFASMPKTDFSGDAAFAGITGSTTLLNTNFDSANTGNSVYTGDSFWTTVGDAGADNASVGQPGGNYGYIRNFDLGTASVYQGVYLTPGTYTFAASVQSSGVSSRLFAAQASTGTVLQSLAFNNTGWSAKSITFTVATAGTYRLGIDSNGSTASAAWARIDSASLTTGGGGSSGTIFTSETPTGYDNDAQYELGTKFYSVVDGYVTKARIYTNASEGGDHTVRIWDASGATVVAGPYTWSITAGTAGWKEFTLPTPLAIGANTDYIVAVSTSTDQWYAASGHGFDNPIANGNLVTYTGSGLFSTTLGAMPSSSYNNGNYFRDIVFVSGTESTIYTTQTPALYDNDAQYELGTKFYATVDGTIAKVRIYTNASEGGSHTVRIWDASGATVVAGPYTWSITAGTAGWKEFTLPTALAITANTDYIVSVSTSTDQWYAATGHAFDSPIANGNLVTYAGSGVFSTTLGAMPTSSYNNNGYFRDVVFVPGA
ncbi:DUF4082 domain-containing protein [Cohnella fermenti]|uniref:DUF4082 domain-containing protein n=1 Tax=Cohnella fermenti TaxID=2565925 RepID=A0A4S4BQB8_9BACL|nr:DUF4082 domain-containing protein [Cohnella fermenti]THF77128.1 DUF4082 domain-containing protein [Cohnella fermenti]